MMKLQTFLARRNDDDMDPPQKGGTGRRYKPSSEKGCRLMTQTSLERGSDDETVIDDGMTVMFQHKRG